MISLEKCLKNGFIKSIPPSPIEAKNQIGKATVLLDESKSCLKNEDINAAVITAYAALFDAARALLFRDGYRERSHVCVVRYLESKYTQQLGSNTLILLDEYKKKRHKVVYESDYYATEEEADTIVKFAEKFIKKIREILSV